MQFLLTYVNWSILRTMTTTQRMIYPSWALMQITVLWCSRHCFTNCIFIIISHDYTYSSTAFKIQFHYNADMIAIKPPFNWVCLRHSTPFCMFAIPIKANQNQCWKCKINWISNLLQWIVCIHHKCRTICAECSIESIESIEVDAVSVIEQCKIQ